MTRGKILPLKRRREEKTDYKLRLGLLKSGKPRVVVRTSNNYINIQLIEYNGSDKTKLTFNSKKLSEFGWDFSKNSVPASYLAGLAFGAMCAKSKVGEAVSDIGTVRITKGNRVFAVLKGCVDGGLNIPYSEDNFPSEERIKGKHISEDTAKKFDEVKQKILDKYANK